MEAGIELTGNWEDVEKIEDKIKQKLHESVDELGDMELFNIRARTPWLTGALQSDETYIPHYDPADPILLELTVGTENQEEEWGRVYAQYQEGGLLGMSTYTNDPREMFGKVLTDDVSQIEEWATRKAQEALDELAEEMAEDAASEDL